MFPFRCQEPKLHSQAANSSCTVNTAPAVLSPLGRSKAQHLPCFSYLGTPRGCSSNLLPEQNGICHIYILESSGRASPRFFEDPSFLSDASQKMYVQYGLGQGGNMHHHSYSTFTSLFEY